MKRFIKNKRRVVFDDLALFLAFVEQKKYCGKTAWANGLTHPQKDDEIFAKMFILKTMYFNYHYKAKQKIREGKLVRFEIVDRWNAIAPAMVLYFTDSRPMPIREYRWQEYFDLFHELSK